MPKTPHLQAHVQARKFFEIMWEELPTVWHDDMEFAQFEFELWLATFAVATDKRLSDFELLTMARKRAERYYQRDLKQPHHTPVEWAFFRFRLEMALIGTITADYKLVYNCCQYANILANYGFYAYTDGRFDAKPLPVYLPFIRFTPSIHDKARIN